MTRLEVWFLVVTCGLAACGGDDSAPVDGSVDSASGDSMVGDTGPLDTGGLDSGDLDSSMRMDSGDGGGADAGDAAADAGCMCADDAGGCADLQIDPLNCGACGTACAASEACAGGMCRSWAAVGGAVDGAVLDAVAHAAGSDGTAPFVAWVGDDGGVRVHSFAAGSWTMEGPPIVGSMAQMAVDIAFDGTQPYVTHAGNLGALRTHRLAAGAWDEIGAPGYAPPCVAPFGLSSALESSTPHVAELGAGGCGLGVSYARWTGALWWETPMPPAMFAPGLLTMNGSGSVDLAWDGTRMLLAMVDSGSRYVRYWQDAPAPGAWVDLGASLNEAAAMPGGTTTELLSMTVDVTGAPHVAFAETVGGTSRIYVKRWDGAATGWTRLGTSLTTAAADQPSIAFVGGMLHVAYVEEAAGTNNVFVSRWDESVWSRLGASLNPDAATATTMPALVDVGGVAHVAFREGAIGAGDLFVRRLE